MRIESIQLLGCRDLSRALWDEIPAGVATLAGPSPQSSTLRDVLHLLFASYSSTDLTHLFTQWKWGDDIEVIGDDLPEQVIFQSSDRAAFLVTDEQPRRIQVDLTLALDAAQLGQIRDALVRDPHLLQSLLLLPQLSFRWSALFNRGLNAIVFHSSTIKLGEQALETGPHPPWLKRVFRDFSNRFSGLILIEDIAELAANAALSLSNPSAYASFVEALSDLGEVRAARDSDGKPLLLLNERPLSQWSVLSRFEQAALVHLTGADIVWIDGPLLLKSPPDVQIINAEENASMNLDNASNEAALSFRRDA